MSSIITKKLQIGQSATASQNFTWYVPTTQDGTIRLGRGNIGATTSDILKVNSDGAFNDGKPAFHAYQAAGDTASSFTTGAWSKVLITTESFDTTNSYDTSNKWFIAPMTGYYFFNGSVYIANGLGGKAIRLYINGSASSMRGYAAPSGTYIIAASWVISLAANDKVELYCYQDAGSTQTSTADSTSFAGFLVRGT